MNIPENKNPEQIARDKIDKLLRQAGWSVQDKDKINFNESMGIGVRHYLTQDGKEADYILFVDRKPVGVIEAKKEEEGHHLTVVEDQSGEYAASKLKYLNNDPLPYVYESTGTITRFTNFRDPKPRSRPVFTFHRPETFKKWLQSEKSLRHLLTELPLLNPENLRGCQIKAITKLEQSFKNNRPKALMQMATGSGKTYTAITSLYRLLKFAKAKRVLFLVDTRNLGEQAEQEFMAYTPNDDNRKFTELYSVQRLSSSFIDKNSQVCISTIQRLYSILKGEELDDSAEEENPAERMWQPKEPMPVVYNTNIPIEFFDFIIIDECHRSIYNLWKQVLDYFDSFLIGLTATPDKRTFGFFNENVVSEYTHEEAVTDNVNVGYDVYIIETKITKQGAKINASEFVDKREKLTRRKRWEQLDEDVTYSAKQLDKDVVNPSQIRHIIRTFKNKLPEIFPGRKEIPKTLIFAKTDSHADDIIQIVREEFEEGNDFCRKVTYNTKDEDPKSVLARFRNAYYPRIAVTVDMIATGTDVKPLECLLFMRDVKSRNYFEQMKGRGTRTLGHDDLKKVTPSAISNKTHFVIVDAVGVTKSLKTDSRPLERKPSVPLKDLLNAVTFGARDEDVFISLANRLTRLDKQINQKEKEVIKEKANGTALNEIVKKLLNSFDPDEIENAARKQFDLNEKQSIREDQKKDAQNNLQKIAADVFTGDLNTYIENVRRQYDQIIDGVNLDEVERAGWDKQAKESAQEVIAAFKDYLEIHKDEIIALSIFYNQPYRRRELTFKMIKEVFDKLKADKPLLSPRRIWQAYEQVEKVNGTSPKSELTALVSLIRRVTEIDQVLTPFDKSIDKNFQDWIFKKHAGAQTKFTEEQMNWLRMIKDHIATSMHIEKNDFDNTPFADQGGLVKAWNLFSEELDEIIDELNEVLVA